MLDVPNDYRKMPPEQAKYVKLVLQYVYSRGSVTDIELRQLFEKIDKMYGHSAVYSAMELRDITMQYLIEEEEYIQPIDQYSRYYILKWDEFGRAKARAELARRHGNTCPACIEVGCVCDYKLECLSNGPHDVGCHGSHE